MKFLYKKKLIAVVSGFVIGVIRDAMVLSISNSLTARVEEYIDEYYPLRSKEVEEDE